MSSTVTIRRADYPDSYAVTRTIAAAFHPMDVCAWLVPDPAERARVLQAFFGIHVDHALGHGQVWTTDERAAVAVWFLNDAAGPPPAIEDYDRRLDTACGPHADRFRTLDAEFDKHHPTEAHHHLAFLAVTPDRQGHGLGTALLWHHHAALDRAGIPAYLEASSPPNRVLYARHGYADHGPAIQLPDGPQMWPMWRPPQPIHPA